jgi:hypothetical protein
MDSCSAGTVMIRVPRLVMFSRKNACAPRQETEPCHRDRCALARWPTMRCDAMRCPHAYPEGGLLIMLKEELKHVVEDNDVRGFEEVCAVADVGLDHLSAVGHAVLLEHFARHFAEVWVHLDACHLACMAKRVRLRRGGAGSYMAGPRRQTRGEHERDYIRHRGRRLSGSQRQALICPRGWAGPGERRTGAAPATLSATQSLREGGMIMRPKQTY